jgi:hypothetical protein
MIVRDEAVNLPGCLASAVDLVDETIVVDTGSSDSTREVAAGFGARVVDFAWIDDFAAARNESIRQARGDWIFWLDADDRIDDANREKLRTLFAQLPDELLAYLVEYRALENPHAPGVDRAALFRNHAQVRWEHRVHEQILPALERQGGRVCPTDVVIWHKGYGDPDQVRRKLERNFRLLQLEYAETPFDPLTLFNLGRTTLRLDRPADAVPLLREAIARLNEAPLIVIQTAYALLTEAQSRVRQFPEALETCRQWRTRCPDDLQALLAEGLVRHNLADVAGAEACFVELLRRDPANAQAQFHLARIRPASAFGFTITT